MDAPDISDNVHLVSIDAQRRMRDLKRANDFEEMAYLMGALMVDIRLGKFGATDATRATWTEDVDRALTMLVALIQCTTHEATANLSPQFATLQADLSKRPAVVSQNVAMVLRRVYNARMLAVLSTPPSPPPLEDRDAEDAIAQDLAQCG